MKKIAVTGALGHIGSHFIHSLQPSQYSEVRLLDNLSAQRYPSLFNLPRDINFTFIEESILDTNLQVFLKDIDVVIHLAAITNAPASVDNREQVEMVNYEGTRLIADACLETGASLFFPSTTSVYGSQSTLVDETCIEVKPQSPYAEYKLRSEELLEQFGNDFGLRFITCRFGTIFGSSIGMRFHTAVNKFCWQAAMRQPLTVWQTAFDQQRPYLGIRDATRAIHFVISEDIFDNNVYNVLSLNYTVRGVIDCIKTYVPDLTINFVTSPIMNQLSYQVSVERFTKVGFVATDTMAQGVKETLSLLMPEKT